MLLFEFLQSHRTEILTLAESKTLKLAGPLTSSEQLKRGLPLFYEHLILFLQRPSEGSIESQILADSAAHGRELLRLNYSLSHVVHSYGAMCQAVTELAQQKSNSISSQEFNDFNLCLDIAISAAVSEFQFRSVRASEEREVQHLGFLVHELRNALSSATVAFDMIQQGLVGSRGSTSKVLGENLARMRDLIDRSLSEVRMRADPEIYIEKFYLNRLVDQILITAKTDASHRKQTIVSEMKSEIEVETDRQLLLSAIANLVQNALKYSKVGGKVCVRARTADENLVIEVEDECGGIESDTLKSLFRPFTSGGFDRSGLGLGLTIVQRAVTLLQGKVTVSNSPGRGCAFLLEIPKKIRPTTIKKMVPGQESVQPKSTKP